MKILLLGANGQVGREFTKLAAASEHEFIAYDRARLDLAHYDGDTEILTQAFGEPPHAIINAAAYTQVDKAETESALADNINGTAIAHLCRAAADIGSAFLHYSTDYVFDGTASAPYSETAPTAPINRYGASKLKGEKACMAYDNSLLIRTSWVHSPYGNNFIKSILRAACERQSLNIVSDQIGTPTSAQLIASLSLTLLECKARGLYHLSNAGMTNWYEYARFIVDTAKTYGYPIAVQEINPIAAADYPTEAARPAYSVLDTSKLQAALGAALGESLPDWQIGVKNTLHNLLEKPL